MAKIAVIRIRGLVHVKGEIEDTMQMLNLRKKFNCTVVDDTPSNKGMINKARSFITWGEVNDEMLKLFESKKKGKKFIALHPPKGGFERKGIKLPFAIGGALGNRKEKINELLKRML